MEYATNDLNKGCSNNRWNIKSHFSSWVAGIGTWFGDVLGDYTTCSNHDIIADADGHDGGVRADTHPISDGGFFPLGLIAASWAANSEWVVDEHGSMTDEAIFADGHKFTNESVRLDAGSRANRDAALDFNEGADEHLICQCATIEIDWFDQCDSLAKLNIDDAVLVDFGFAHMGGVGNLSLEWLGCIMLKARRGKAGS